MYVESKRVEGAVQPVCLAGRNLWPTADSYGANGMRGPKSYPPKLRVEERFE